VPQASADPIARLGEYRLRAEVMHDLLHEMREAYDNDLDKIFEDARLEFEAFFVVLAFRIVRGR
jgi:hypothetical protein